MVCKINYFRTHPCQNKPNWKLYINTKDYRSSSQPIIEWRKNGKTIRRLKNRNQWLLKIQALKKKDSGEYECVISNIHNSANFTFHLTVLRKGITEFHQNAEQFHNLFLLPLIQMPCWNRNCWERRTWQSGLETLPVSTVTWHLGIAAFPLSSGYSRPVSMDLMSTLRVLPFLKF